MTQSSSGGGGSADGRRGHGYGRHHHHSALCCLSSVPAQAQGAAVEGALHKWTNYGRGWRGRWFSLRDGVLSYSKIRAGGAGVQDGDGEVRLIGASRTGRADKPAGVVCLKVRARSPPFVVGSLASRPATRGSRDGPAAWWRADSVS
jgi:oxysterol-binding protein 1